MSSVLVVDDEANIRELVSVYLVAAGFGVAHAASGPEAVEKEAALHPDLVLLDIMLPGLGGLEVCRAIRARSAVPIVMLSARGTALDKVALLEAGADDYMTKPFDPPELVARVRAILRRSQRPLPAEGPSAEKFVVGGLVLDPGMREVSVDGRAIELTAREFDLLETMARSPGIVFSRGKLLDRVWGATDFVDERGVDVHIRHLREKLGDDATAPRFIETVRGVGYRVRRDGG
jgi:DNA-binding response OmpR family regulator